jgi:hypothetical protein
VSLGVLHPVLNDLHQLLQEHQRPLVAAHQGLLGQVHRRRVMLAVGQPALQGAHQVAVEVPHRVGQLGFVLLQAGLQQGRRLGFHLAHGPHLEVVAAALEAGPQDLIATGSHQLVEPAGLGTDLQTEIQQPLKAMAAGFESEAMGTEQHRGVVGVVEGVDYASTHAGSALVGL